MPTIQNRRGTAAQWTTANPVLAAGELGYETDTNRFKIGNGTQAWNVLAYTSGLQGVQGPLGPQGVQGLIGLQGVQGVQGVQGNFGPQGIQGVSGPQGVTGIQGPLGSVGGVTFIFSASTSSSGSAPGEFNFSRAFPFTSAGSPFEGFIYINDIWGGIVKTNDELIITAPTGRAIFTVLNGAQGSPVRTILLKQTSWTVDLTFTAGQSYSFYVRGVGAQGTQGLNGPQGTTGIQGLTGIQGVQGIQGITGVPDVAPSTVVISGSSYNLSLTDKDKMLEVSTTDSFGNVWIPLNSTVPFSIGTQINIVQTSVNPIYITYETGVTINSASGNKLRAQWSTATLYKRGTNSWLLFGDLSI